MTSYGVTSHGAAAHGVEAILQEMPRTNAPPLGIALSNAATQERVQFRCPRGGKLPQKPVAL
jgi:hypothetical protein